MYEVIMRFRYEAKRIFWSEKKNAEAKTETDIMQCEKKIWLKIETSDRWTLFYCN